MNKDLLAGILALILVVALIGFWYVLVPLLLTLLVNSFGFEVALWQSMILWFLIVVLTKMFRQGNGKNGN